MFPIKLHNPDKSQYFLDRGEVKIFSLSKRALTVQKAKVFNVLNTKLGVM